MRLIKEEKMNKLIADEGKHIRGINDVYEQAHTDENENKIEEHFPYYYETIYLPKFVDLESAMEMYVEEPIENE